MSEYAQLVRDTLTYLGYRPKIAAAKAPPLPPPPKPELKPEPKRPSPPPPPPEKPAPIAFDKVEKPAEESFSDVRRMVQERLPHLKVIDTVPDDAKAVARRNQWKERQQVPEIALLAYEETIQSRTFLANLAKAISLCIAPCDLFSATQIEKQKKWDQLLLGDLPRLILVTDYTLHGMPALRRYLREEGSKRFLGQVPLFLLSELPLYFQNPKEKAALWAAVQHAYGTL